jgi:hypothetical protein
MFDSILQEWAASILKAEQYSSTVMIEAACSSETSLKFYQTTRCHIPEDSNLHCHYNDNLKSSIMYFGISHRKTMSTLVQKYWSASSKLLTLNDWRWRKEDGKKEEEEKHINKSCCVLARYGFQQTTAMRLCIQHTGTLWCMLYDTNGSWRITWCLRFTFTVSSAV